MTTPDDWVCLQSDALTAQVDPLGAQLSVLRDAQGRDLLWNGDPAYWNGRAPILFPIVGALHQGHYLWGGKHYALPRHGFARGRRFEVVKASSVHAVFRLRADEATRAVYPFDFELELRFVLQGPDLAVTATVRNGGPEPMPASVGFHPALRWPLPGGASRALHRLEFEVEESAPVRRLDRDGLLTPDLHASPVVGRTLMLADALFEQDVVIFDQPRSHRLHYCAEDGPGIEVRFPDARYLGLWSKPGAPFVCIEPWRGVADPQGFEADLREKPGIELLAAGASLSTTLVLSLIHA
jgi:galactose mutarotase-like enzyme